MNDFNTTQLLTFLKVVQTGSISKAARSLFVGQPAVSMQIKALEDSLGVQLFNREGRKMSLTPAGEIARRYAFQLGELKHSLKEELQDAELSKQTLVRLGFLDSIPKTLVTAFASKILQKSNPIRLQLTEGKGKYLVSELRDHQLDGVILNYSPESSELSGMKVKKVSSFPVGVFGHAKIELDSKTPLNEILRTFPLILPTYHSRLRGELDRYLIENEIKIRTRVEAEDTSVQKLLAIERHGLALLPCVKEPNLYAQEGNLKFLGSLPGVVEDIWLMSLVQRTISASYNLIWSEN